MGSDQIIFNLKEDRDDSFYDDFVKGYQERRKASVMEGFDEEEMQKKYDAVSLNWNSKDTIN